MISYDYLGTFERQFINITNCYIDCVNGGTIINTTSGNIPGKTIFDFRNTFFKNNNSFGVSFNLTQWSTSGIEVKMLLKDCIFYCDSTNNIGSNNTGHIISNALQGSEWQWYWQGNLFYSDIDTSAGFDAYMWFDIGTSAGTIRLMNITTSIANRETVGGQSIIGGLLTPVPLYGPLKISPPAYFNRS